MWSALGKTIGGKEKSLIIKDYIDGMEKIMKRHSRALRQLFIAYTMDRTQVPDPDSGDTAMWDEIVVNNIKMKKIHVSAEFSQDFEYDKDMSGFPFETYTDDRDIVKYINKAIR